MTRVLSRNYKPTYVAGTRYDPKWSYIRQHTVGFWPMWERGSLTMQNWALPGQKYTLGALATWLDMTNGPGLNFTGASTSLVNTLIPRLGTVGLFCAATEQWTAVVRARVGTLTSSRTMLARGSSTGGSTMFTLRLALTTGNPAIILRGGATNTLSISGFVPTEWNIFWVVWDGTTATFYLNAAQAATSLTVGAAAEETTQKILLGAYDSGGAGGGALNFAGGIDFAAILDVPLSPPQIARWSTDLFAPWRPARRFGKGVASGSAVLSGTVLT